MNESLTVASRAFVCARLVTYENKAEGQFLREVGGSNRLSVANTTFAILAPDGKTMLTGSGRSPRQEWQGSEEETLDAMLDEMAVIAYKYPGNGKQVAGRPVPYLVDVRRGLNVAACDQQPLVVVTGTPSDELRERLSKLVWSPEFRGQFAFAKAAQQDQLKAIDGVPKRADVFVVQPGEYGLDGEVIAVAKSATVADLTKVLQLGLTKFVRRANDHASLRAGVRKGIEWDAEDIEVRTQPMPQKKRGRRGRRR